VGRAYWEGGSIVLSVAWGGAELQGRREDCLSVGVRNGNWKGGTITRMVHAVVVQYTK